MTGVVTPSPLDTTAPVSDRSASESGHRPTGDDRRGSRLAGAAAAVAALPVVVATWRAVGAGWLPVSDNAYFALRASDVFGEHHPLLGTWTSASISLGVDVNNPGPLLFDVLAPATILGGPAGVAIGVALLNIAAIVGTVVVGRRQAGPAGGAVAGAAAAALAWSMGSELAFDPWQPHSLLLTFLALLALTWGLVAGDRVLLPWAVAAGSLIVQTHLSYAYLVAVLWGLGVGAMGVAALRERRAGGRWIYYRRRLVRTAFVSVVVLVACWSQSLVEELTGEGRGNLSRLASSVGGTGDQVGPVQAARVLAAVVARPLGWVRPAFAETFAPDPATDTVAGLPSATAAAALLVAVAVALALAALVAVRARHRSLGAAVATIAVTILAGLGTLSVLPLGGFGLAAHQFRWLWPIGVALTAVLAAAVVIAVTGRYGAAPTASATNAGVAPGRSGRRAGAVALIVAAVFALAALPAWNPRVGPAFDRDVVALLHDIDGDLASAAVEGPLVLDPAGLRFAEPWSTSVVLLLERRGVEVRVEDDGLVRQLGPGRRATGTEQRLLVVEGIDPLIPPGGRLVASATALGPGDAAELATLRRTLTGRIEDDGLPADEGARRAVDVGLVATPLNADGTFRDGALVARGELAALLLDGYLDPPSGWEAQLDRYGALEWAASRRTASVIVAPARPGS